MQCQSELGFLPDRLQLVPLTAMADQKWTSEQESGRLYRKCSNYLAHHVCNWMVANDDDLEFCVSCRLNKIIPDLNKAANYKRWRRMERAKRRTLYNLFRLGLQVVDRKSDPVNGLEFRFMEDIKRYDPYSEELVTYKKIMTGHETGTITINIQEADHSHREAVRENMNEPYRTTLGHVRHETGHFFWYRLIAGSPYHARFRELFGDERNDYQQSLQLYYQNGPRPDWQGNFISAYASAHAWEDWAETWAHYLHITDTMETAYDFGLSIEGHALPPPLNIGEDKKVFANEYLQTMAFDDLLTDWMRLTILMNALNRSMGMRDAYPFSVSVGVAEKLRFVHQVIAAQVSKQYEQAQPTPNTPVYAADPAYTDKPG